MAYAVGLFLNLATEAKIYDIWQSMKAAQISSHMIDGHFRPHISLAVCDELDLDTFRPVLENFAQQTPRFELWFPNIGIFMNETAVMYIGVTVTHHLIDLHERFLTTFSESAEKLHIHYEPGQWVPHVTLALGINFSNVSKTVGILEQSVHPLLNRSVEVQQIGVINTDTGETPYYFNLPRA